MIGRYTIFSKEERAVMMLAALCLVLAAVIAVCVPKGNEIECRICGGTGHQLCQFGVCDDCHDRLEILSRELAGKQ